MKTQRGGGALWSVVLEFSGICDFVRGSEPIQAPGCLAAAISPLALSATNVLVTLLRDPYGTVLPTKSTRTRTRPRVQIKTRSVHHIPLGGQTAPITEPIHPHLSHASSFGTSDSSTGFAITLVKLSPDPTGRNPRLSRYWPSIAILERN